MSDIDAKIEAVLDRLDADIERVTQKLEPILHSSSVDELSEAEPDSKTAVPYALSAYALSSMLFAYLRSEGKDTAIVMPELARVKERLERLSEPPSSSSRQSSREPAEKNSSRAAPQPSKQKTAKAAAGKHMRFEDASSAPKRSKRTKPRR